MEPFKILNHIYQVKLFFELAMAMVLLFTFVIFSFDLALKPKGKTKTSLEEMCKFESWNL